VDQDALLTEHSLAERIRRGDREAEEELVQRFYRKVLVMAKARVGDRQAALDIAQETMIGVLEALRRGRVNNHQHVAGYVHGTARNLINNHFRYRDRSERAGLFLDGEDSKADPEQMTADRERLELVDRALRELNPDDREVLRMTLVDGLKPGEIAERMGLSSEVVRKRKSRATKRLKEAVLKRSRNSGANHSVGEGR
jgi:RNA polymerase sigma-70 factor (ECF subfamily)